MTNYSETYLTLYPIQHAFSEGNNIHARTQICLMLENINSLKFWSLFSPPPIFSASTITNFVLLLVTLLMLPMLLLLVQQKEVLQKEENLIMRHEESERQNS